MKALSFLSIAVFITIGLLSCQPEHVVNPQQVKISATVSAQSDTNKTLIANTSLVGTWNVVTDTVAFEIDTMYHGKTGDHYIFTKYGNIYINNAFNKYVDTGVYTISHDTVNWINSYISEGGGYSRGATSVGAFVVSNLTSNSLTLTQFGITPEGPRYEQIKFTK